MNAPVDIHSPRFAAQGWWLALPFCRTAPPVKPAALRRVLCNVDLRACAAALTGRNCACGDRRPGSGSA